MSRERDPGCLVWEVQLYEPFSRVWICKGYGRAITDADPAEVGRAVLACQLARAPVRGGETFRAVVRTGSGGPLTVLADELADRNWTADPSICRLLPAYLRDALA
ncbi:hypothetical protein ABZ478_22540 [Streptomyces sp. NPDC005706]|uniref:hypothetical protein n=1 Tax=Streptomyces sp. NPDC005706 TaxID=3157169 RepID=UPI0033FBF75A